MDAINKGSDKLEKRFVSLLPLSLNAYKASNKIETRDYGGAEQLWHMLVKAEEDRQKLGMSSVIEKLRAFLTVGYNEMTDEIEDSKNQDFATWMIASITNQLKDSLTNVSGEIDTKDPLLCMSQAHLLADDVDRLLAYQDVMSRTALIDSLSQIMMLHIGIYLLRVAQLLPLMVEKSTLHIGCGCEHAKTIEDFYNCEYKPSFQMDMVQNFSSKLAKISARNIEIHDQQLSLLYEAMLTIRKKMEFLAYITPKKHYSLEEILSFDVSSQGVEAQMFFKARYDGLREFLPHLVESPTGDYFSIYIDTLNQQYNTNFVSFYKRLLNSTLSKNNERGILRQITSYKKYAIGSDLLDTLIHIAMLENHNGIFETKILRLDQFLNWLRDRYGFYIDSIIDEFDAIQAYSAVRDSKKYLTTKLQEIGYYQALSDAYNTQWLIARYDIKGGKAHDA
jgi:hypothetical protein